MKNFRIDIDNATLVDQCMAGDRQAMSMLYTRFAPKMLHVIRRYVADKDDAHDILHDGFVVAFTRLSSLRDPSHVDYWLATIMKNLSLKFLQEQNVASLLEDIPDTADDPDIIDLLDFETLESLIRKLPEGYQQVFRLAVLENKSHKEISQILGIAPNSSSSQLFHAKLRLRELINEHRLKAGLLSLLLLIATSGIFVALRNTKQEDAVASLPVSTRKSVSTQKSVLTQKSETGVAEKNISSTTQSAAHRSPAVFPTLNMTMGAAIASEVLNQEPESNVADNLFVSNETHDAEEQVADSASFFIDKYLAENFDNEDYSDEIAYIPKEKKVNSGWSAKVSFDTGMMTDGDSGSDLMDGANSGDLWGSNNPTEGAEDQSESLRRAPARKFNENLKGVSCRHYLPVTVAVSAEKHLSSWLGIETGVAYSYLRSDFESSNERISCKWHYLEIPVKANFYAYSSKRFGLYGSCNARVSLPVYCFADVRGIHGDDLGRSGSFGAKPCWSAGASIGAAYRVAWRVSVFIEPSLQYHFPQHSSIPNVWTDNMHWSLSIPVGIRFSW